jgi:hypothetical protein
MTIPILRTLTWKSKLNIGNYANFTIQQIYDLKHTRYLRWIYYNVSAVTFIDEILTAINVNDGYKIDKPGKNKELGEKVDNYCYAKLSHTSDLSAIKVMSKVKKEYRLFLLRKNLCNKYKESKSFMQSKNHGR